MGHHSRAGLELFQEIGSQFQIYVGQQIHCHDARGRKVDGQNVLLAYLREFLHAGFAIFSRDSLTTSPSLSKPTACPPFFAAAKTIRPSPEPMSKTTSPFLTAASSIILSTTSCGEGTKGTIFFESKGSCARAREVGTAKCKWPTARMPATVQKNATKRRRKLGMSFDLDS